MRLLGLIPEPPFHPRSWSGSSANFFTALRSEGTLATAAYVKLSNSRDWLEKTRVATWPLERWKEQYRASVPRFQRLTHAAGVEISRERNATGVMQVGAWFSSASVTRLPCFSYHDGNAAMSYRHYGRGLLSESRKRKHLSWERDVYHQLRGIFVMSSWLAESFTRDFGVPQEKLHVVGAGINTGELPEIPVRDFSTARFLYVGKDFPRKGGPFLLRAFAAVKKVIPHAELTIVGPTIAIDQPGVNSLGFLSHAAPAHVDRLRQLFLAATAVVLPSLYEPFGISLLEGMAFGLPCIATERCAMPEIVRNGQSGLIVPAENSELLAAAMIALARDPQQSVAMGIAGRKRVEADFTWDAVARKIKVILTERYGL